MNHSLIHQPQPLTLERNQNMNKHITAVIAESGAFHDLQIAPGTTTREIRNQLRLGDHYLITKRGAEPFGDDENIYGAVADGEKLFLSTPVEVGAKGLLELLLSPEKFAFRTKVASLPAPLVRSVPRQLPTGRSAFVVQRDKRPYWEQRGWTCQGGEYCGYYRTAFGSWKGKAKISFSGRIELFIQNPPKILENHSHWPCFRSRLGGWHFIHTNEPITDLSSGILAIENILTEAHSYE
jgi:hypothetical protein